MNTMPPQLKFVAILVVWVAAAMITIVQLVMGMGGIWFLPIAIFGIAGGVTSSILSDGNKSDRRQARIEVHTDDESDHRSSGKRKNDQAGGLTPEMLALLDEDDIAELRQRLKNRLIDRIEGGSDGELSSLDALLAEQNQPPKSRR